LNECPNFVRCSGSFFKVSYCTNPRFDVLNDVENFYSADIVGLENVFFDRHGQIFDENYKYLLSGCPLPTDNVPQSVHLTQVSKFTAAIQLQYPKQGKASYFIPDILPLFYLLRQLISTFPTMPIFVSTSDSNLKYLRYLGIDPNKLNIFPDHVKYQNYIFSQLLFVPTFPKCQTPPAKLWAEIRKNYETSTSYELLGHSLTNKANFKILVINRGTKTRQIPNFDDLLSNMEQHFPGEVATFEESQSTFEETAQLFSTSTILVGVHGSEFTNMIFMPKNSIIIEIQPTKLSKKWVKSLAKANSFLHSTLLIQGNWEKVSSVNVPNVIEILMKTKEKFQE